MNVNEICVGAGLVISWVAIATSGRIGIAYEVEEQREGNDAQDALPGSWLNGSHGGRLCDAVVLQ